MTEFINKQITKTSIYNTLNGILWVVFTTILFYGFTFWFHPKGSEWFGVVLFDIAFVALFYDYSEKIFQAIKCIINPKNHKTYKTFEKYGNATQIKNQVEKEITSGQKQFPKTIFTQNWIIKNSRSDFDCINIADISWFYEKKTTTFLNFVVPVKTDYSIIIHTNKKQETEIPIHKKNVPLFLENITIQNNRAHIGFTDENKIWWENQNL